MPCRVEYDDGQEHVRLVAQKNKEINRLTALLCHACSKLQELDFNNELRNWYREHQEVDRQRLEAEKKRREEEERNQYLASVKERLQHQLSPDEKEALGL